MSIEIRNLSITSKVVQRQGAAPDPATPAGLDGRALQLPADWRIECQRMIAELLALQRER